MSVPLRIGMIGNWPAIDVLDRRLVKPRYRERKTTHPSSWLRALSMGLAGRDDVASVDVLIDSREVARTCCERDGKLTLTFVPKWEPGQTDPFHGYWPGRWRMRPWLQRVRPHLVHGHGTETAGGWLALHSGLPNGVTLQGIVAELQPYLQWSSWRSRLMARMEERVVRQTGGLIVSSAWSRRWALQFRSPGDICFIPNVVSPEFLEQQTDYTERTIVCAGTLTRFKNPEMVIRAFAAMTDRSAQLVMIGEGHRRPACESLSAGLGVHERVTFTGRLSRLAMIAIMRRARCLALGSRIDTSPNVIIESQAMGLPVVGAAGGGIPDMIEHGRDGFVVPVDDDAAMANCFDRLIGDQALARQLGAAGRERVNRDNTPTAVGDRHLAWYREIIDRRTKRS